MTDDHKRRNYVRINVPLDAMCHVCSVGRESIRVLGIDISLGGIRLIVDRPLGKGDKIEIVLKIANVREPICMVGEVTWESYNEQYQAYETGVRFYRSDRKRTIIEKIWSAITKIIRK